MTEQKATHTGFTLLGVLLSAAVIFVLVTIGIFVLQTPNNKSSTSSQGNAVTLVGKITSTTCPGNPDVGCSIVVNGYNVPIVHGFTNTPDSGTVTGYVYNEQLVGKTAHVYAEKIDTRDVSIFTSSKYYVRISN